MFGNRSVDAGKLQKRVSGLPKTGVRGIFSLFSWGPSPRFRLCLRAFSARNAKIGCGCPLKWGAEQLFSGKSLKYFVADAP